MNKNFESDENDRTYNKRNKNNKKYLLHHSYFIYDHFFCFSITAFVLFFYWKFDWQQRVCCMFNLKAFVKTFFAFTN